MYIVVEQYESGYEHEVGSFETEAEAWEFIEEYDCMLPYSQLHIYVS